LSEGRQVAAAIDVSEIMIVLRPHGYEIIEWQGDEDGGIVRPRRVYAFCTTVKRLNLPGFL
jgi:hypothetical protein